MLSFLNEFIGPHLHILIEQITSQYLLSVLEVQLVRGEEQEPESNLCHELQILIVEKDVIVVEEQELHSKVIGGSRLTADIEAKIKYFL